MKIIAAVFVLFFAFPALSQDIEQSNKKSFLIILATKNYSKALKRAQLACNDLGITLNLRNMYRKPEGGLTSSEVCGCGERHGYVPRGRFDDGEYISIEYTDQFNSFEDGYYIVVVSSGARSEVEEFLPKVQKHFDHAYIKDDYVHLGCMH
jgi:hypothetical protein